MRLFPFVVFCHSELNEFLPTYTFLSPSNFIFFCFYFGEPVEFDPALSYGASSGAAGEKYLQLSYT